MGRSGSPPRATSPRPDARSRRRVSRQTLRCAKVPEELKAHTDTSGEASLRGHLKAEGDEQTGSQSYIPPDPRKDDKALHTALNLTRDILKNSAYRPTPRRRSRTGSRYRAGTRAAPVQGRQ